MTSAFDLIVVGAGPGGSNAAAVALQHGLSVAQVDRYRGELTLAGMSSYQHLPSGRQVRVVSRTASWSKLPAVGWDTMTLEQIRAYISRVHFSDEQISGIEL